MALNNKNFILNPNLNPNQYKRTMIKIRTKTKNFKRVQNGR